MNSYSPEQYQHLAERTVSMPNRHMVIRLIGSDHPLIIEPCNEGRLALRLLHCCVGITTELGELIECTDPVNMQEELGDLLWYAAEGVNAEKKWKFESMFSDIKHPQFLADTVTPVQRAMVAVGEMTDVVKRFIYYGKDLDMDRFYLNLNLVCLQVIRICDANNFAISKIAYANIEKLKARYPDKFSEEKAVNRDLEMERQSLESNLSKPEETDRA